MRERFQSKQTAKAFKKSNTVPKVEKVDINISTSVSPIYTFSLAGKLIMYTPIQGTNRKKYFNHFI